MTAFPESDGLRADAGIDTDLRWQPISSDHKRARISRSEGVRRKGIG